MIYNMKNFIGIVGVVIIIASIAVGAYVGLWLCIVGGVSQIINGLSTDPFNATGIGIGVLRFILAGMVGWLTVAVGWMFGIKVLEVSENM